MTVRSIFVLCCLLLVQTVHSQELFVQTEPASNMPAKSIGLRLNNRLMPETGTGRLMFRLNPEIMWGINKKWMVHLNGFASNMMQTNFRLEGALFYAKYRFLSIDDVHSHFRMAAYGKASVNDNPIRYDEIDLYGNNSGFAGGIIATQLLHKLALSADLSYTKAMENPATDIKGSQSGAVGYTLSAGYLLLPRSYTGYKQTNMNLYLELIGKNNPVNDQNYTDIAPSVQFIFNSVMRVDLGYRVQLHGNMTRPATEQYLLRLEYNLFNIF